MEISTTSFGPRNRAAACPPRLALSEREAARVEGDEKERQDEGSGRLHRSGHHTISQCRYAGRLRSAGVVIAFGAGARPAAQAPALKDVLKRTAAYVADFSKQLSQIVAEETYAQTVVNTRG